MAMGAQCRHFIMRIIDSVVPLEKGHVVVLATILVIEAKVETKFISTCVPPWRQPSLSYACITDADTISTGWIR